MEMMFAFATGFVIGGLSCFLILAMGALNSRNDDDDSSD